MDELKVMHASGRELQPDELVQAVGMRAFVSDEQWLPASDFPELAKLFHGETGRAIMAKEIERTKSVRRYALVSLLLCLLAAALFWLMPYRDAQDARGELEQIKIELGKTRKDAAVQFSELKVALAGASKRQDELGKSLVDATNKLLGAEEEIRRSQESSRVLKDSGLVATEQASQLRSLVASLRQSLAEAEKIPAFWPGGDALRAPADAAQVRLVSMIPDRGYVYVVASKSYPKGSVLLLKQSGMLGARMHFRVVSIYGRAQGETGMALHNPDMDEDSAKKITAFGYGEALDCVLTPTSR